MFTWTVNHHRFHPDVPTPYVIAIVDLSGQRVVGNVVDCDPEDVHIGMAVDVEAGQPSIFRPVAS